MEEFKAHNIGSIIWLLLAVLTQAFNEKIGQKEMQKGKFAEEKNTWKHNVTAKILLKQRL